MEASVDGTTLTGNVLGEIVDGQRKKELLETIARQEGISLEQVYRLKLKLTLDNCSRRWGE
jgi:phosphoserine phosphatase